MQITKYEIGKTQPYRILYLWIVLSMVNVDNQKHFLISTTKSNIYLFFESLTGKCFL